MPPQTRLWLNILRLGLLASASGWGIAFTFTFASWEAVAAQLRLMGAGTIEYRPLLDYWLRMASAAFGCIGIASLLACLCHIAFRNLIRLLGPFHFVMGITLAVAAWRNHLTMALHPTFVPDIVFCFFTGTLIQLPLWKAGKAIFTPSPESDEDGGGQVEKMNALIRSLEKLCHFLVLDQEWRWLPHFQRNLGTARDLAENGWSQGDLKTLTGQIKGVFGGMGSFNDYVPGPPTPETKEWMAKNGDDDQVIGDVSRACEALMS